MKVNNEIFIYDWIADKVAMEFEINDYPEAAWKWITAWDYLTQVAELSTT